LAPSNLPDGGFEFNGTVYKSSRSCQPEGRLIGKPGMRKAAPSALLLLTLLLFQPLVFAAQKTYEAGKLLSVESPEVSIPIPVGDGQTMNWPMHFNYKFEVQKGDVVFIGSCQKSAYKAEWHVGDDVEFRLHKDKMYLKRPNGKELTLVFLLEARLGPDGRPITVLKSEKR
jgi:hypothetical protein